MTGAAPITLKEVQLRLGTPQHVLIHLCEKGVIEPDFAEASGRGKRREFSERNVFEFAVALALRRIDLPVATTALVVRILRAFMRAVGKAVPDFDLPSSRSSSSLRLELHLYDGDSLVLVGQGRALKERLILSARVDQAGQQRSSRPRIEKLAAVPSDYATRLSVNLTKVAKSTAK